MLRALAALPVPGQAHLQAVVQALMPAQQAALPLVVLPAVLAPGEKQAHPVRLQPRVTPPK
uniref:hypothetical protein n=1 Tax=Rothia aeria TaxID=172042 RepID=UPI00352FD971